MTPDQILARLKSMTGGLTGAQLGTLAATFVGVVALIVGSAYWLNIPTFRVLYSEMDPESASAVVATLEAEGVPYRLDPGGRSIRVPADRLDQLRLEFASQGLPASGRIGFEIFDRTAFGATEFLEQVNFRRALEGEIGRTIETLSSVASARVHIAQGRESIFGRTESAATASVVLKLRGNRPLAPETIGGIGSLVAASVEGLQPENVVVVDSFGRSLATRRPDSGGDLDGTLLVRQQQIERGVETRIVTLLEPVVGPGRVRARVSARLNPESAESTEELWDPATQVVRSRQVSSNNSTMPPALGVAGARSNLPPSEADDQAPPDAPATPPAPQNTRSDEVTNYEISKSIRRTVSPPGEVERLTVAVILDDERTSEVGADGNVVETVTPRDPAEIDKIRTLVATAVGLDVGRGDQLTVETMPFDAPAEEPAVEPSIWQRYGPLAFEAGRILTVLVLGVMAFLFVVRPLMRWSVTASQLPAGALPQQLPRTVGEIQRDMGAQGDVALPEQQGPNRLTALTNRVSDFATKQPESAARLLRAWLNEDIAKR